MPGDGYGASVGSGSDVEDIGVCGESESVENIEPWGRASHLNDSPTKSSRKRFPDATKIVRQFNLGISVLPLRIVEIKYRASSVFSIAASD